MLHRPYAKRGNRISCGKVLKVNSDGSGVKWGDAPSSRESYIKDANDVTLRAWYTKNEGDTITGIIKFSSWCFSRG